MYACIHICRNSKPSISSEICMIFSVFLHTVPKLSGGFFPNLSISYTVHHSTVNFTNNCTFVRQIAVLCDTCLLTSTDNAFQCFRVFSFFFIYFIFVCRSVTKCCLKNHSILYIIKAINSQQ